MQDHRGSAHLAPRVGGGARAELILPKLVTSAHSILVLDSDPAVRRAVAQDFRREGFHVLSADAIEAVTFADGERLPSLVVSEVRLRDAEGIDLVERIREMLPRTCLLILTGDPARNSLPGVTRVFGKPWNREQLMSTARRLCHEAEAHEQASTGR